MIKSYLEIKDELVDKNISAEEFLDTICDEISIHLVDNCAQDLDTLLSVLNEPGAERLLSIMIGIPEEDLLPTLKEMITSVGFNMEIDITIFGNSAPSEDDEDTELEVTDADEV